jgi:hypothetical protein
VECGNGIYPSKPFEERKHHVTLSICFFVGRLEGRERPSSSYTARRFCITFETSKVGKGVQ